MRVRLSRNGVEKVIHSAPGHRWLLRTHSSGGFSTGEASRRSHHHRPGARGSLGLVLPYETRWHGPGPDGSCKRFRFGDGSVSSRNRSQANFCGDKDKTLLYLFEGLGRPVRSYGAVKVIGGLPAERKKEIPSLDDPADHLYGWLAGYFAADGDVGKTGRPTLASASRKNLEWVRVICNLIGIGTYGIRMRMRSGFGKPPTPIYMMGIMRGDLCPLFFLIPAHRERFETGRTAVERRGWTVASIEAIDRLEEAFGAVVDSTPTFALEDNISHQQLQSRFRPIRGEPR